MKLTRPLKSKPKSKLNLGRVARIARWEVSRSAGTVDRKTVLVLVAMVLVVGVVGVSVIDRGPGLEDDIYRVGASEDSPYAAVAAESPQFSVEETTILEFRRGQSSADVFAGQAGHLESDGTQKGDAAHEAFRNAIDDYNHEVMLAESDRYAAFPVTVSIQYQQRTVPDAGGSSGDESPAGSGGDWTRNGGSTGTGDSGAGDAGFGDGDGGERLQVPDVGGGSLEDTTEASTPGAISPPFPFESLVLAFLFIVPMNVVIQAYGSTIVDERIKRRGELLLVSPASRYEIVAGKTLPYLLGLGAIVVGIARVVDGGYASVLATLPIALVFLSATFVGAMLARSFKELTFVTVAISVFLTTYTFVPAIFTDVTPIALISPLTLVVMDLEGQSVGLGQYVFSTGAFYLGSGVLFLLGIGLYREEDMFAQKPIPAKVVDAIANHVHGYRNVPLLSILFIPFVFAGQLLTIAVLFAVPLHLALPVLLVTAAAIEELAKSVHVYAGFARSRFDASLRTAVVLGALAGTGFFVGEKFTHVAQFVGLPDLELAQGLFGPALEADPLVVIVLFFAPLVLHVVTSVISAAGASRGRTQYALAFVVATLVHAGYNWGVITLVG